MNDIKDNENISHMLELGVYNKLWNISLDQLQGNKQAFHIAGKMYSQIMEISIKHQVLDELYQQFG